MKKEDPSVLAVEGSTGNAGVVREGPRPQPFMTGEVRGTLSHFLPMSLPQTNAKLYPPMKLYSTMFLSVITKSTCPSTEKQINKQIMICSHHAFSHNNGHEGMNVLLGQGHLERISGIFPEGQRLSTISGSWECLQ